MNKLMLVSVFGLILAACCDTNGPQLKTGMLGDTPVIATTADYRLIMARPKASAINAPGAPAASGGKAAPSADADPNYNVCAEPSPDVAKAISNAFSDDAKLSAAGLQALGGTGASAAVENTVAKSRSQSLMELGERLATTQMLRDGLFNLCAAYANGAITREEYALVLSRYGDTMVTLLAIEALGSLQPKATDTGSSKEAAPAAPASLTSDATPASTPKAETPKAKNTHYVLSQGADSARVGAAARSERDTSGATRLEAPLQSTPNTAQNVASLQPIVYTSDTRASLIRTATPIASAAPANTASTTAAVCASTPVASGQTRKVPQNSQKTTKTPARAEPASSASSDMAKTPSDSGAIADAIVKLQQNYLAQSHDAPIIVLCALKMTAADDTTVSNSIATQCDKATGILITKLTNPASGVQGSPSGK